MRGKQIMEKTGGHKKALKTRPQKKSPFTPCIKCNKMFASAQKGALRIGKSLICYECLDDLLTSIKMRGIYTVIAIEKAIKKRLSEHIASSAKEGVRTVRNILFRDELHKCNRPDCHEAIHPDDKMRKVFWFKKKKNGKVVITAIHEDCSKEIFLKAGLNIRFCTSPDSITNYLRKKIAEINQLPFGKESLAKFKTFPKVCECIFGDANPFR